MQPEVRSALASGEYRKVVDLLLPLKAQFPASCSEGAELRLWLATGYQGLNEQSSAVACCREVLLLGGSEQRRQAQAVLAIIEAPVLQRQKEWCIELPSLGDSPPLEGLAKGVSKPNKKLVCKTGAPPAPPVGRTRAPLGFALVAGLFLVFITFLLSGCVRVDGTIEFHGPGRLQFQQQLERQPPSRSSVIRLQQLGPQIEAELKNFEQRFGIAVQAPKLQWQEQNWLIGVQQQFNLEWDLNDLDPVAGLSLHLHLKPLALKAVELAEPFAVQQESSTTLDWQLLPGELNSFAFSCWRWSGLGLGAIFISLLLTLSLLLQNLSSKAPLGRDR
jgi:hypothetical protein